MTNSTNNNPRVYNYTFKGALSARYFYTEEQMDKILSFCYYHKEDFPIQMHTHEFYEINIVTEGKGIHYVENNSFLVKQGDFFIIPPNTEHGYSETSKLNIFHLLLSDKFFDKYGSELKALKYYSLLFNIEPKLRVKSNVKIFPNIPTSDFMFLNTEISKLYSINRIEDINETEKSIKTLNLICELSSIIASSDFSTSKHSIVDAKQISDVLTYIDNNYNAKITLNDLCRISNMSRSTLLNHFKLTCSCSPSEYILSVRIENAVKLLETTELAIATIAQECGFFDSSHFTKYFYAKIGFLPKDYRSFINKK